MAVSMIPRNVAESLNDMLDNCVQVQPGEKVLVVAHLDGLSGGPNLVDRETVAWTQDGVRARGAYATELWLDEPVGGLHGWRVPAALKAAMAGVDAVISYSFDLPTEEIRELGEIAREKNVRLIRGFASTAPLLASDWARTPWELVAEVRLKAAEAIKPNQPFTLTDPNGTNLVGKTADFSFRAERRRTPFPEWVYPPVNLVDVEGELVFDRMLSWWSRYVGIPPFFREPIRLSIKQGRIVNFAGGTEAQSLKRFYSSLNDRFGSSVYELSALHGGIHPNAAVSERQCPDPLKRRWVEHSHTSNIHFHLGNVRQQEGWNHMLHVTGDVRHATWKVGESTLMDKGYLAVLEDPEVRSIAARYPDRPTITQPIGAM